MCEPCNGKGWILCDFCKGQKTNVRAENKRIYRRCPSCKAVSTSVITWIKTHLTMQLMNNLYISEFIRERHPINSIFYDSGTCFYVGILLQIGCILCSKCKVFKCVTFPNYNDGEELAFWNGSGFFHVCGRNMTLMFLNLDLSCSF